VSSAESIVAARGLCKRYGRRQVVSDLTFGLAVGECLGLLGPNGAGKTTTIRMATCFSPPTAGSLSVFGLPMTVHNHAAIKARLGIMQQEESLDPDLTVEQNLVVYAGYFGIPRTQASPRVQELLQFAELSDHRTQQIRRLSGGMKRRLMLARALLNEPELLVLDEPTTGLDPQARRLVWERIRALKRRGTTILLTTHYMEEAARLCDRLIIMDEGRIVAEGTPADLIVEHVGHAVIEVPVPEGTDGTALDARLRGGPWRTEQVGEMLYLYVQDGDPGREALAPLAGVDFVRRPATLEDVFLTLTGHRLRD
jgi:lipooligosaccharide transport system ATP-binding protein